MDDTLQRKTQSRFASLCVSIKASYSLTRDTKRGFYFALDSCLTVAQWATLNKGKPDSWEVNTTRAMEKTTNEKVDDGDYDVSGGVKWLCVTYISRKTEFGNA